MYTLSFSFPNFKSFSCSMSDFNCHFLTYIQTCLEKGKVIWYSHFLKNFPEFVMVHKIKGFGIVNKAEVDIWYSLAFSMIQQMLAI